MDVAIGVDSHKSSLAVAALDELGRVVGAREFPNDARGHDALLRWGKAQVATASSASRAPASDRRRRERLRSARVLTHRERKSAHPPRASPIPRMPSPFSVARVAARSEGRSSPQRSDVYVDLELLSDHRD